MGDSKVSNDPWKVFDLQALQAQLTDAPVQYREFLNVPSLSCGLYRLKAGARDMQSPHDDDEIYFVLSGRAKMRLGDVERTVGPGMLLYVGATESHSFFEIEEDMTLLVFFASSGS
ncbi:MAG: cupin domain-containing protein [Pseudomonadales bacterium]|nr:cupin domain-containing protein [Pseudomonadales bacterium]